MAISGDRPSLAMRLYAAAMGIRDERLAQSDTHHIPRLLDVLYYAYHKGFWAYLRGLCFRPMLGACAGRFYLGRQTKVLFPNRLKVGRNVSLGDYLYLNSYGGRGVTLGHNVRIREFGWVQVTSHLTNPGDGLIVGDDTYIGPHCILGAGGLITVGHGVTMGAYVQLLAENHVFAEATRPINEQGVARRGITVGDGAWLGNSVIVLDGVQIGEGAVIGAGSVVTQTIPAFAVAVGNPARVIKTRQ